MAVVCLNDSEVFCFICILSYFARKGGSYADAGGWVGILHPQPIFARVQIPGDHEINAAVDTGHWAGTRAGKSISILLIHTNGPPDAELWIASFQSVVAWDTLDFGRTNRLFRNAASQRREWDDGRRRSQRKECGGKAYDTARPHR